MLRVRLSGDRLHFGSRLSMSFQRTLRIPETGTFPLPPGLGSFPISRVRTSGRSLPRQWRGVPEFAIPLYQREALWLGFSGPDAKPSALKIAAGGVDVISGTVWREGLHANPQDYIVLPDQPWLDGFNSGDTHVRQFVAVPLGQGLSAEEELTGAGTAGGLQVAVYVPKPGWIAKRTPIAPPHVVESAAGAMGLGAGGRIRQKIYPDPHGIETWDRNVRARVVVHLFNLEQFREVTGREPPPTPVSPETYASFGLPWFDVYDEESGSVAASDALSRLKGVPGERRGPGDTTLDPRRLPVRRLRIGVSPAASPSRTPAGTGRAQRPGSGTETRRKPTERKK